MKRLTIKELAKRLCDKERRKHPYLVFFLGDPGCPACYREARKRLCRARVAVQPE